MQEVYEEKHETEPGLLIKAGEMAIWPFRKFQGMLDSMAEFAVGQEHEIDQANRVATRTANK